MKIKKQKATKLAMFAGAAALAALAPQARAQSSDALIDKLVDKGILTVDEAKDLRVEADKDFKTALQAKTGMPDYVTGYKISGDFRGRFEQFSSDNAALVDRTRLRYRLRFGITASIMDNLEAGFRLGSGDASGLGSQAAAGSPLSNNSTMQDNFSKKMIYIDTAYGKWTAVNSGGWLVSATVGKMENPFTFTPMVFDPDLTPEGAALQAGYTLNDHHSLAFTGGAFVMDEEKASSYDPFLYGGQLTLNSKWNDKLSSSVGVGGLVINSQKSLSTANVPYINQGNTRSSTGVLLNKYEAFVADASVTYTLDSFPLYAGAFPIKVAGEGIINAGAAHQNSGYWTGVTFGKSGAKKTWDLTYRYEYLQADAWYDQLVDDDNGAYYATAQYPNTALHSGTVGYFGGTNVKGHMVKATYAFTDSLTFSATCFINDLINPPAQNPSGKKADLTSSAIHFYADLMWKF
jgi:Putative porin